MSKTAIQIWGRNFELDVFYSCYPGEEVLESQKKAFELLADNSEALTSSLEAVKEYVYKTNDGQLQEKPIGNIFRYVMPKSIFVPHVKGHRIAAIICNYKFDMEHGMAVVFEDGKFKTIGAQDLVI